LSVPPTAICWIPSTRNGRAAGAMVFASRSRAILGAPARGGQRHRERC
jgi:hypothetical protein